MVSHLNEWPELGTNRGALNVRKWVHAALKSFVGS
jgi:hypothetical protein